MKISSIWGSILLAQILLEKGDRFVHNGVVISVLCYIEPFSADVDALSLQGRMQPSLELVVPLRYRKG